jgi:N-carbamoyl-L-amino-acid hydrolase
MPAPGENLKINGERLWDSLMEMAKIGPGIAGGNNRQTLTDEDSEGRHLFQRWCDEAGMTMGVDEMGNMFARREGTDPDALPVYVGSHLDTQPTGGKYDGVLGVLGGLEIIRTLNDLEHQDEASHRGHQLDQRGGDALRARHARLGRLCRQAHARLGL